MTFAKVLGADKTVLNIRYTSRHFEWIWNNPVIDTIDIRKREKWEHYPLFLTSTIEMEFVTCPLIRRRAPLSPVVSG